MLVCVEINLISSYKTSGVYERYHGQHKVRVTWNVFGFSDIPLQTNKILRKAFRNSILEAQKWKIHFRNKIPNPS